MKKLVAIILSCFLMIPTLLAFAESGTSSQAQTGGDAGAEEPVRLEFFIQHSQQYDALVAQVDKFNAANPDVIIEPNNAPSPEQVIQTRVINNDVPEILSLWSDTPDYRTLV